VTVSATLPARPLRLVPGAEEAYAALAKAVAAGAAEAFVLAADALVGGAVRLCDRDGTPLASSRDHIDEAAMRTVALGRDARTFARLEIARVPGGARHDRLLCELADALLDQGERIAQVRELRHRLCLLTWTSSQPEIAGSLPWAERARCRPVVIAAGPAALPALRAAAAREPLLAGIGLVAVEDLIIGVCADDDQVGPEGHAAAWTKVAGAVAGRPPSVAVGRPAAAGPALNGSYQQARSVARLQSEGGGVLDLPAVAVVDELGPMADVLDMVSAGQVVPFVRRVLGGLLADTRFGGHLAETVYAYVTTGGSPQEAGRLLHLHASSVKYRMRVVREMLGARLDDPAQRFDIELALRLYLAGRGIDARVRVTGP
jgi:PucR C-terminal helix-turn-helix domain